MLRWICIIVSAFFSCLVFPQEVVENDSLLLWQADRPLKWEDFKGSKQLPKDVHLIHKVATSGIFIKKEYSQTQGYLPEVNIRCYFEKYVAWTITNDIEILEHEQIHFDIAELYTRKVRKCVSYLSKDSIYNIDAYIKKVDFLLKEYKELDSLYDEEVLLNYEKQQKWRSRIARELEELKDYEYVPEKSIKTKTAH